MATRLTIFTLEELLRRKFGKEFYELEGTKPDDPFLKELGDAIEEHLKGNVFTYTCSECEAPHTGILDEIMIHFPKQSDMFEICPVFKYQETHFAHEHPFDVAEVILVSKEYDGDDDETKETMHL